MSEISDTMELEATAASAEFTDGLSDEALDRPQAQSQGACGFNCQVGTCGSQNGFSRSS